MRVINAFWEKRNLGLNTTEIVIEQDDTLHKVLETIAWCKCNYLVVRLPSNLPHFIYDIQKTGLVFAEDMITLKSNLQIIHMNPIAKRMYDDVSYELMSEDDIIQLNEEIKKGLFDTDRVYLDPFFSNYQAAQRYINWIDDEIKRGARVYKYMHKEKAIGFFALRQFGNGEYDQFLGGFYREYQKGGIGMVQKAPEAVKELGGKSVTSNVSTNNFRQIKMLVSQGYIPEQLSHIFIMHK